MIAKEDVLKLELGQTLYHISNRNADGSPQRWRVNGKVKLWKTRPDDYRVPLKYGLKTGDYLTPETTHLLCLTEEEALAYPHGQSDADKVKNG